jgi:hypothetical protein
VVRAAEDVTVVPALTSLSKAISAAGMVVEAAEGQWGAPVPSAVDGGELMAQSDLLLDIFGNPFRPVAFDPAWRTEHTAGIASKMYEERDFAGMPILADALEEAGCDNADILAHCRETGVHVRGCWVVDLVLAKE